MTKVTVVLKNGEAFEFNDAKEFIEDDLDLVFKCEGNEEVRLILNNIAMIVTCQKS